MLHSGNGFESVMSHQKCCATSSWIPLGSGAGSGAAVAYSRVFVRILPSGEYVAAENNTGRLTRWIAKQRTPAPKPR
jgi:hypothetical protein